MKPSAMLTDRMLGFIGLGVMGDPMARNILRSGAPLIVWNRSPQKCDALRAAGARIARCIDDVFAASEIVFLMLADEGAIDTVLGRGSDEFTMRIANRTIVQMGTIPAQFSKTLEADVVKAGGSYVEAPVSGSRKPAEEAQLVAMVAGAPEAVSRVTPVLDSMCRTIVPCGAVPKAALMKFAVNIVLITMVTGLTEAVHFARAHDLDMDAFRAVLDGGPMASSVSRGKLEKLIAGDFGVQAAVFDVLKNNRLIAQAAQRADVASPLLDTCYKLFAETLELGFAQDDMIAVIRAIEARRLPARAATQ